VVSCERSARRLNVELAIVVHDGAVGVASTPGAEPAFKHVLENPIRSRSDGRTHPPPPVEIETCRSCGWTTTCPHRPEFDQFTVRPGKELLRLAA